MSKQLLNHIESRASELLKNALKPENNLHALGSAKDAKRSWKRLRQALTPPRPERAAGAKRCRLGEDGRAASRLGIRLEQEIRHSHDSLEPDYPLLASCYSHFGHLRLAAKNRSACGRGGER
ncbi:hypothetical protein SAMN02745216_01475 [Desulfatibacillum alkenivorans DSM 16219]|uniref:Uncharacterized protein n=1 Tax=Desulfatibacillum alkenivorans DSM 16219 TaxID=1121393 RepID=A0A1M6IGW8_9BACT|nr:hypothetical protein [Desulfatibacillum alkenivorans]SHJ33606.1 hypothetical protein SAMN02745216_01475 [Desulfatibacillum alkenivorans DSM 16219]